MSTCPPIGTNSTADIFGFAVQSRESAAWRLPGQRDDGRPGSRRQCNSFSVAASKTRTPFSICGEGELLTGTVDAFGRRAGDDAAFGQVQMDNVSEPCGSATLTLPSIRNRPDEKSKPFRKRQRPARCQGRRIRSNTDRDLRAGARSRRAYGRNPVRFLRGDPRGEPVREIGPSI